MSQFAVAVSHGDFLEFRGLLATDAVAGFKSFDVTYFAEITHPVEFSIPESIKPLDLKCPVGFHRSLEPDVAVGQAFVQ
jgi:hypothetical protein